MDFKEVRNAYYREWRRKNKDKVSQYNKEYWKRKALNLESEQKLEDNSTTSDGKEEKHDGRKD